MAKIKYSHSEDMKALRSGVGFRGKARGLLLSAQQHSTL